MGVFTGLLETLSREEGQELVKRYGGKVTTAPSSKTSFVVLGNDAGPSKLRKIQDMKIKTINEDGLFALISKLPANGGDGREEEGRRSRKGRKGGPEARQVEGNASGCSCTQDRPKFATVDDQVRTNFSQPDLWQQSCR